MEASNLSPETAIDWQKLGDNGGGSVSGQIYTRKQCYIKALELDRECASAWQELGNCLGGKFNGRMYTPKECYIEAVESDPSRSGAWQKLGECLGGKIKGRMYNPKQCCIKALESDPKCATAWSSLGDSGGGTVKDESYSCKECYVKALELDPKCASAWHELGDNDGCEINGRSYDRKECYTQALESDPECLCAWHKLGDSGGGEVHGQSYCRKQCYVKALESDSKLAIAWFKLGFDGGGEIHGQSYNTEECYIKAVELDPKCSSAWHKLGDSGGCELYGQSYNRKQCYVKALESNPTCASTWTELGRNGGGGLKGGFFSSKDCYINALKLDSKCASAWHELGDSGGSQVNGRRYNRKQCYIKAVESDPKCPSAWHKLGDRGGCEANGRSYSKKDCYIKALESDPKDADAWCNVGDSGGGEVNGRSYDRKECLGKALELDPKRVSAWINLGLSGGGEVTGRSYGRSHCYLKAIELDPYNGNAWFYLGDSGGGVVDGQSYYRTECYIKAIELNPKECCVWVLESDLASGNIAGKAWLFLAGVGGGTVRDRTYTAHECYTKAFEHFRDLPMAVDVLRAKVARKSGGHKGLGSKAKLCKDLEDTASRGITVEQMLLLAEGLQAAVASHSIEDVNPFSPMKGQQLTWEALSMYQVCDYFVKPLTASMECSYVQYVANGKQQPNWMVSHAWSTPLHYTVRMLKAHSESRYGANWKSTLYWVCTLANNQHDLRELQEADLLRTPFARVLLSRECTGMVLLSDESVTPLTRIWCVFEAYITDLLRSGTELPQKMVHFFDVACPVAASEFPDGFAIALLKDAQHRNTHEWLEPLSVTSGVQFPLEVACKGTRVDILKAKAARVEDRYAILNHVASGRQSRDPAPETHENYARLNGSIHEIFASAELYRLACQRPSDKEAIARVLELRANPSSFVRNGCTALHAAVGANPQTQLPSEPSLDLLEMLIDRNADVNSVDATLKTVLDYASDFCSTAQRLAPTVDFLKERGAKPFTEVASELEVKVNESLSTVLHDAFGGEESLAFGELNVGGSGAKLLGPAQQALQAAAAQLMRFPTIPCNVLVRERGGLQGAAQELASKRASARAKTITSYLQEAGCRNPLQHHVVSGKRAWLSITMMLTFGIDGADIGTVHVPDSSPGHAVATSAPWSNSSRLAHSCAPQGDRPVAPAQSQQLPGLVPRPEGAHQSGSRPTTATSQSRCGGSSQGTKLPPLTARAAAQTARTRTEAPALSARAGA